MAVLFELFINFIEGIIDTRFFICYLGYKNEEKKKSTAIILVLMHFIVTSVCNYIVYFDIYSSSAVLIASYVGIHFLLKGRVLEKVFVVGLYDITVCVISITLFIVFDKWIVYDANGYMQFGLLRIVLLILAKVLEFFILEMILHFRVKENELVSNRVYLGLNGIIFATWTAQRYLNDIIYKQSYDKVLVNEAKIVIFALILMNFIAYILCMNLAKSNVELLKVKIRNVAFESRMKDIQLASEQYQRTLKVRHEIKNELLNLRIKIESGKIEEAKEYLEDVLNVKLAKTNTIFTDNMLIDAVINRCMERCEQKDIVVEYLIECKIKEKEEMDIAVLLSNLLDNAVEAAEQTEIRKIYFKIKREKNNLYIFVSNSCNKENMQDTQNLPTTKADKIFHGYGLLNINDIVQKYHGQYSGYVEDNTFVTDIVLYIP